MTADARARLERSSARRDKQQGSQFSRYPTENRVEVVLIELIDVVDLPRSSSKRASIRRSEIVAQ